MGRNSNSLQHELLRQVLPNIENNKTSTAYKRHIKNFAKWAKRNGYKKPESITVEVIQEYESYLENDPRNYSPSTIHTYIAPVCMAAGVSMDKIRKPKRSARSITKGRERDTDGQPIAQNLQGRRQEKDPRYERLVALQAALGIRRNELRHLVGADLINKGKSCYVRVRRGKGGKEQYQYILPKDVETVRQIFSGIRPEQRVFSNEEINNKINLHGLRAKHGKDCYNYYAEMLEKDPGAAEQEQAVKDGLIADNPVKDAMINKSLALRNAKVKDDDDFFSYREAQLFLERVESHKLYELFFVTLFFGLRREEVLGLRWSSVDFKAKTLRVNHTVTVGTRVNRLNSTKTDTSNRTYPLTDDQVKMFEHLKKEEIKNRELFGEAYKDNDYIFKNEDGSLHYPDYPSKQFKKVIKENPDLPQRTKFHGLRTSCVSILVHENFDVKGIQKWVGHKDINTTLKIYAKVKEKEAKEEILHGMTSIIRPKSYD